MTLVHLCYTFCWKFQTNIKWNLLKIAIETNNIRSLYLNKNQQNYLTICTCHSRISTLCLFYYIVFNIKLIFKCTKLRCLTLNVSKQFANGLAKLTLVGYSSNRPRNRSDSRAKLFAKFESFVCSEYRAWSWQMARLTIRVPDEGDGANNEPIYQRIFLYADETLKQFPVY